MAFLSVRDLGVARRFYVDTLGLECIEETPYALVVEARGIRLRLTPVPDLRPQPFTVGGWKVDDIDAVIDALVAAGVTFNRYDFMEQDARGVWEPPGGDRIAWFKDPDGNTLSVTHFSGTGAG
jgi:catechol 2,3-dioxygenase-like lactoylglutathione lyase family enzyme